MLINSINKKTLDAVSARFGKQFIKEPLFMYFCSDINKRSQFIEDYMKYYIPRLADDEIVFVDKLATAMITLVDPQDFEYKFKGLSGQRMKKYSFSSKIFVHRENLENICEILLSYVKPARVMTFYNDPNGDFDNLKELIDEAIAYAEKEDVTLVYDTFSKRYIDYMISKGFTVAYSKPFMETRFIETVMTYNV